MAAEPSVPADTADETTPRVHVRDLAEASIHLDGSVVSGRQMVQHLSDAWTVINSQLAWAVLDLINTDPGFRLDDRTLEALGGTFAEATLLDHAIRRRWLATGGVDREVRELPGYENILGAIQRACVR